MGPDLLPTVKDLNFIELIAFDMIVWFGFTDMWCRNHLFPGSLPAPNS